MDGFDKTVKVYKEVSRRQEQVEKLTGYLKDLNSLLQEPTKGNAIRIVSKRVLGYVYSIAGGPGAVVKGLYGEILNHFIDALYFYEKEAAVKDKLELLVKNGKEAKQNATRGIAAILEENVWIRNKHMPSVWQYGLLLGLTDSSYRKRVDSTILQLQENTRRRVKSFDQDIIFFLAVDTFIRSIPATIEQMRRELKDPTNAIEQGFRVMNLKAIDLITLDVALLNFNGGLGRSIDKYIQLRNDWAQWINLPAMSREMYQDAVLPDINFE